MVRESGLDKAFGEGLSKRGGRTRSLDLVSEDGGRVFSAERRESVSVSR